MQSFAIWVTSSCNMQCSYCYEDKEKENFNMSQQTLKDSISFIEERMEHCPDEDLIVDFHGGEPLLQFDKIKYAIEKLNKLFDKRVKYGITTNGTILTEDILKYLVENFEYSLSISIDGAKETHDLKRRLKGGKGSFDVVIKNARRILERRKDVRVRMTVDSTTVNALFSNVCALNEEGFKLIVPGIDYFDPEWNQDKMAILYEQMLLLKTEIQKGTLTAQVGLLDDYHNATVRVCTGGWNSFHINPHGEIYPCAFVEGDSKYVIGNVCEGLDLKKVQWFHSINKGPVKGCENCAHEQGCISTRCKILNEILVGNFYKPSPVICNVENLKYRISK